VNFQPRLGFSSRISFSGEQPLRQACGDQSGGIGGVWGGFRRECYRPGFQPLPLENALETDSSRRQVVGLTEIPMGMELGEG
jgi:hypothetical protein